MQPDGASTESICFYSQLVYKSYQALEKLKRLQEVKIDGRTLDIPSVVAVSRYGFLVVRSITGAYLRLGLKVWRQT